MRRTSIMFVLAGLVLVAGACSDSGGDDDAEGASGTESTSSSSVAPDSTDPSDDAASDVTMLEASPVSAPLDQIYPGTEIIASGQVTANWYQEGGNYVVVYVGLDLDSIGPACPGNSIQLPDGSFSSVSNAPTAAGGCEGATTPEPPTPPQVCGDLVVYSTAISTSQEGTLYGSFEQPAGDSFVGGTSTVAADAASAPEIVTGGAAYSLDGTEYTC